MSFYVDLPSSTILQQKIPFQIKKKAKIGIDFFKMPIEIFRP